MKRLFLIIGAPGSGKTTDAEIIASNNKSSIAHYSTGNLLREEVDSGSNLGKTIDSFVSKGNLCPLEIVLNTVIKALKKSHRNTILIDGFPRSEEQMNGFHLLFDQETEIELASVIEVVVSEEVARDRVLGRARGADDNAEVFNNRMKVYTDPLETIQKFYEERNLLKKIDGERSIEEIVTEMETYIKSLM